jgi:hypothetical protein
LKGAARKETKRADKKIGKIRKVEGPVARGVEGLGARRYERTDHRLGSILLLPDLLIFLFHPLHLGRPAPSGCV